MSTPKFSILVANYNNAKFLKDLFQSIEQQSFKDFEVVFVDDASSDNSLEVAASYALKDSRIKIHKNTKNLSCGQNKIKCIQLAEGEICGFVDPDDMIEPNALETMIRVFDENPDASLAYSNFCHCNEALSEIKKYEYDKAIPDGKMLIYGTTPNHFTAFRKSKYEETDGINPNFKRAIDRDLVLKLEERGNVIHIDDYLYKYRINSNSISCNSNSFKAEYWAWRARLDACECRGWNPEEIYSEIQSYFAQKLTYYDYRQTTDFKLGSKMLAPFRLLKYKILKKQ